MNVWSDLIGSGNRQLTRDMVYSDSTQELIQRKICIMFTGKSSAGITMTINGNSRTYQNAGSMGTYIHSITTTAATINASITISTTDSVQGLIYAPTMLVARGSGAFS